MWVEYLITHVGYPLVFVLTAAEYSGLPLPGETAVLVAAATAGAGKGFTIWIVFLLAALGAIAGDMVGYQIGRRGGRALFERLSGRLWFRETHIRKAENFFARRGFIAVFAGRWISYLRLFTALMAGVSRMPYHKFLLANVLSGILWAGAMSWLGFKFGKHLAGIEQAIEEVGFGILAIALIAIALYFLITNLLQRREHPPE